MSNFHVNTKELHIAFTFSCFLCVLCDFNMKPYKLYTKGVNVFKPICILEEYLALWNNAVTGYMFQAILI